MMNEKQNPLVDGELAVHRYPEIRMLWRRRATWLRAAISLNNACSATCRSFSAGKDRDENTKLGEALLARIKKGTYAADETNAAITCLPLLAMHDALRKNEIAPIEKALVSLVRRHPAHAWVKSVRGFGELNLAALIGECGDLWDYKSVAAVWKRMGCGMVFVNGKWVRQRKVRGEEGIIHRYNADRHSIAWNLARCVMMLQPKGMKYRDYYDEVRAKAMERPEFYDPATKKTGHVNLHALRLLAKRLIRDLYLHGLDPVADDAQSVFVGP